MKKIIYLLILVSTGLFAQTNNYEHLGIEDGLSHPWVKAILLDNEGNLWIGTANGLNKYNGREIQVFKNSREEANSISDNFINALSLGPDGNLWIGTLGGGLNCYLAKQDTFVVFRSAPKVAHALPTDHVTSLFLDSRNQLWVGTKKGLLLYKPNRKAFVRHPLKKFGLNITGNIQQITEDHLNQLWIATDQGVFVVHQENRITQVINSENSPLPKYPVRSIYEDEQHNVWLGTIGGGVLRINGQRSFSRFTMDNGVSNNRILTISGDKNGRVYLGTEGGGLNIYYLNNDSFEVVKYESDHPKSIESNSIHATHYDEQSSILWIGTYHGGINFTSRWDKRFKYLKMPEINNNYVLSIAEDNAGNLHVGTDGGGVNILKDEKRIRTVDTSNSKLPSDVVLSIFPGNTDQMWYGTFQGGLSDYRQSSKQFFNYLPVAGQYGISDNDVNTIYQRTNDEVWLGTMNAGVSKLAPVSGKFQNFKSYTGDLKSISHNYISQIDAFSETELFVLTGSGIDIMNVETGDFVRFNDRYDVDIFHIRHFHIDKEKRVWLGTDDGLYCVRAGGKTLRFDDRNGLPSLQISSIEEDDSGNLWVSTHSGLVKAIGAVHDPESTFFHLFTKVDGLPGLDFNRHASTKTKGGTMYFGSNSGLLIFKPEDIRLNPVKPKVTFTALRVMGKEIDFKKSDLIDVPLRYAEEIKLDYNQNIFSIDFTSSNFLLPSKNKFCYKLEGFDGGWSTPSPQNYARYTNIPSGEYLFKVKSANNDGVWNDDPAVIKITIIPPWWELNWVRTVGALVIVLILIGAYKLRIRRFKQARILLKNRVDEATAEIKNVNQLLKHNVEDLISKNELLQEQNVSLENQAEKIQSLMDELRANSESKLKFFTNVSHDLRTPLTLIIGPVKELLNSKGSNNVDQYRIILDNANRLLRTVNQLLDFRKLETGNAHLVVTRTDIVQFVHDIFDSFDFLARKRKIDYQFISHHEQIIGLLDMEKMEKVLMNLISNAFKFTPDDGSIRLEIGKENDQLKLSLRDTGQGIKPEDAERIFDLYYEGNPNNGYKGTGLGLAIIKQLVELHYGKIAVDSSYGAGTLMVIHIPLGEQHYEQDEHLPDDKNVSLFDTAILADIDEDIDSLGQEYSQDTPYKLAIVEDNVDIRKYIKKALSSHFHILEASNGKEGLHLVKKFVPDFVISDVMMPEMTGTEMCRRIKDDPDLAHIPVVLLTAYSGDKNKVDGYSSGADDYIVKPFDVNLLRSKMLNIAITRTKLLQNYKKHPSTDLSDFGGKMTDTLFMNKVIATLNEHLSDGNFGVDEISEQLSMSRRNLLRKIKANTGLSVSEFIRNVRLKKAAELLRSGTYNISEVAYKTGFNDPKYFSKCFRQEFEISPSDFVKHDIVDF